MTVQRVGWGFGGIISLDRFDFAGYGTAVVECEYLTSSPEGVERIDSLVFAEVISGVRVILPKSTSDEIIFRPTSVIERIEEDVRERLQQQGIVLLSLQGWAFEPPEALRKGYEWERLREEGVDVGKVVLLERIEGVTRNVRGSLSIDLSSNSQQVFQSADAVAPIAAAQVEIARIGANAQVDIERRREKRLVEKLRHEEDRKDVAANVLHLEGRSLEVLSGGLPPSETVGHSCPQCSCALISDSRFCPECGKQVR